MSSLKQVSLGLILFLLCPALSLAKEEKKREAVKEVAAGMWEGVYTYPQGTMQEPVKFKMVLVKDGSTVAGFIKEPNTFGERKEPWLHAVFKGSYDPKERTLNFTKTYDGTAGPTHDVEYSGILSKDGTKVEGTWSIGDAKGNFTLEKVRLDKKTLEDLK